MQREIEEEKAHDIHFTVNPSAYVMYTMIPKTVHSFIGFSSLQILRVEMPLLEYLASHRYVCKYACVRACEG